MPNNNQHYDDSPVFDQESTESKALALHETNVSSAIARAQQEVQGAIILAKKFPRNESEAYAALIRACKRPSFAAKAEYSFPRGGTTVKGASAVLAREAARVWGNIATGTEIVRDTPEERHIRSVAWDMENNSKKFSEASFGKLIYRKKEGWIKPDERDLRELTNKHGAIAERNCVLQLIPGDFIEDAVNQARATMRDETAKDPNAALKRVVLAFDGINVSVADLEELVGHALEKCSPAEIDNLRQVWTSINDGNSTFQEYLDAKNQGKSDLPTEIKRKSEAETQPSQNGSVAASEPISSTAPGGANADPPSPPAASSNEAPAASQPSNKRTKQAGATPQGVPGIFGSHRDQG